MLLKFLSLIRKKKKARKKNKRNREMGFLPKMKVIITGLLIGLFWLNLCSVVRSNPNTNVSRILCNSGAYSEGDPFATSLAYVLAELETVTPSRQGYDYHNISPYPNAFAYGHAACNKNLTSSDYGLH
uniref:Putative Receptor-like protein kinase-related family protein n=1 Tax=Davidia involucrata TaxID=16924 RepID=A0A5B7BW91_DAVIN